MKFIGEAGESSVRGWDVRCSVEGYASYTVSRGV